jgi:hypothetical protein
MKKNVGVNLERARMNSKQVAQKPASTVAERKLRPLATTGYERCTKLYLETE